MGGSWGSGGGCSPGMKGERGWRLASSESLFWARLAASRLLKSRRGLGELSRPGGRPGASGRGSWTGGAGVCAKAGSGKLVGQRVAETTRNWRIPKKDGANGGVRMELGRGTGWRFYWMEEGWQPRRQRVQGGKHVMICDKMFTANSFRTGTCEVNRTAYSIKPFSG